MRRVLAIVAAMSAGLPAQAQSFEEAVRTNLLLAVWLCMNSDAPAQTVARFSASGFRYVRDDRSTSGFAEIYHRFFAPADTVRVELYEGQMAPHCRAESNHIGPTATTEMLGSWLAQNYPGQFEYRPPGTVIYGHVMQCPSFWIPEPPGGLPFEIWIGTLREGEPCATGQTVSVTPGRSP